MQADWRDGSLAEYMLAPVAAVTPADGLDSFDAAQLAVLNRFIVPFGGLLRGRLVAGEKLVVNGATGAFGTAAVRLGVAMGAARVVAAGRNQAALEAVVQVAGQRVVSGPTRRRRVSRRGVVTCRGGRRRRDGVRHGRPGG